MAISKLKLFRINSNVTNLDTILERFVDLKCVHPVKSSEFIDRVHGLTSFVSSNPSNVIFKELEEIEQENFKTIIPENVVKADQSYEVMQNYIYNTHVKLKKLTQHRKETKILIKKYRDALTQIKNLENLDISLDDLFSCKYVSARVGRLPLDSVEKLKFYQNKPFIFKQFHEEKNYSWCMYLVTNNYEREIDNIFSSLFFERIHIPDFVHGTPENAESSLIKEIEVAEKSLYETLEEIEKIFDENIKQLAHVKGELILLNRIYDARQYVVGLGEIFSITGFVLKSEIKTLKNKYKDMDDVEIEIIPADSDKRIKPPTKLKNNWFTKPFVSFMQMYGLPSYSSIDPTPFLAITYALLFGMMFGDLGQGLILIIFGALIYRKTKNQLAAISIRIGIASAFFGFLYGSFFGNEEILTPIFTNWFGFSGKPIDIMDPEFTMTLMMGTMLLGSILIVVSIIINIIIAFKKKNVAEILFSHNGLSGLIFYLFIIGGIGLKLIYSYSIFNTLTIILFAIIPLLLIFFKQPLNRLFNKEKVFPNKFSGFFVEGIFELFEIILSYLTNTMSFLRVGGFMLSHASMMLIIYTFVDMSSSIVGQSIILVLGNIFVMGLEGLIVGIQVLRLEFYEMFSRYFEGDGHPFKAFD